MERDALCVPIYHDTNKGVKRLWIEWDTLVLIWSYLIRNRRYIQVVSKEASENLNRLDRRGTGITKSAKYYKPFVVEKKEARKYKERECTKVYTNYEVALDKVSSYYEEWGYQPTLKYLRQLNSSGEIPLMTRVKIQDIITDRYLEPSPRALTRHFNKQIRRN